MEFANLGAHCSHQFCHQKDFLPFECDACSQVFCLSHRTYSAHDCAFAEGKDARVIICPLCSMGVRLIDGEDPNVTWERHNVSDCNPANHVRAKQKCPVPKCKTILTEINHYECTRCRKVVCITHRYGPDHDCTLRPTSSGSLGALSSAPTSRSRLVAADPNAAAFAASTSQPKPSSQQKHKPSSRDFQDKDKVPQRQTQQEINQMLKETAERRKQMSQNTSNLPEVCPQCGLRFPDVTRLIQHVESIHSHSEGAQKKADNCAIF
eukprot:GILI01017259.1.p1 GENE.GILI01017259.1~~GILI01017259.1.p1  ORF type:complete len:265 (+),score=-11.48 GILI01017259.1:70-864(+)